MKRATSPMKRAKNSFLNLYKLMSSKALGSGSGGESNNSKCVVGDSGDLLQTYKLNERLCLTVAQGSVVDFRSKKGAIINAANEECLGGGGVDGAITKAGGRNLYEDRMKLPKLRGMIRCPTGDAKLTGPGNYGSLRVPYVIHAVGPNYLMFDEDEDVQTPHALLRSAYSRSMDCVMGTPIQKMGFALLSAGVFRGRQSLATVLGIGVEAIRDWANDESKMSRSVVEDVVLYAFTDREAQTLIGVCDKLLGDNSHVGPPPKEEEIEKQEEKEGDTKVESDTAEAKKEEEVEAEAEATTDESKTEEVEMEKTDEKDEKSAEAKEDSTKENEEPQSVASEVKECPAEDPLKDEAMAKTDTESATTEKVEDEKKDDQEMAAKESPVKNEADDKKEEDEVMADADELKSSGNAEEQDEVMTDTEAKEQPSEEK